MIVIRYLAGVTLVSALVAGCNQSLFDDNPGGGGNGGDPDGGNPVRIDAGVDPDGRSMDGPDAGPIEEIFDDAIAFFSLEQGGQNGRWRYYELQFSQSVTQSSTYAPMTLGQREGMFDGWIGTGTPSPAIMPCFIEPSLTMYLPCVDLSASLLFETTGFMPGDRQPALAWRVPVTGRYRFTFNLGLSDPDVDLPPRAYFMRNSEFDALSSAVSPNPGIFELVVDALADDSILLAMRPEDVANVPVGVSLSVSGDSGAGSCDMALRFEPRNGEIPNLCPAASSFQEAGGTPTEAGTSSLPIGIPGSARKFEPDSYLRYQGEPIDYGSTWTVQFWALLDGATDAEQWLLSDLDCGQQGGLAVSYDGSGSRPTITFALAVPDGADYCANPGANSASFPAPPPGTWHFFRFVRDGVVAKIFMDGVSQGTIELDDLATGKAAVMELGHSANRPAAFAGQIADLRVFSQALPLPVRPAP
jgi:hypothetical protein